jgi:polysaccharide pyruvyl transferase CsaB
MTHFSIFGYYGQGNAGDEAILASLIDGIQLHMPDSTVSAYSANSSETSQIHKVNAFRSFSLDIDQVITGILGRSRKGYIKAARNFFRSDVIIIGGGGLFYDSKETNKWIYGYLKLIHHAKRFGKKVALVGISVGPLHHKESELAIKEAFLRADLISVRDNSSKELLIKCGVPAERIHVIADLVFTLQSAPTSHIQTILAQEHFLKNDKNNIALTPCCYNVEHEGWLDQYTTICERIVSELDCNLWLIPMQRHQNHDDLSAINTIFKKLSPATQARTCILKGVYNAKEVQGILGEANAVLAERLHGSIMAMNTDTPFISIAYMPKVIGVLELAGLENNIIKYNDFLLGISQDEIINRLGGYTKNMASFTSVQTSNNSAAENNFVQLKLLSSQN